MPPGVAPRLPDLLCCLLPWTAPRCILQGAVECSTQALPGGARFSMCLVSRRSRRHPGTRYIGARPAAVCASTFGKLPVDREQIAC